ncbi:hypothetical protein O181_073328 [Austropuccinia psidii MF-1]|uniref:Uncharacterized protein n=1 Tax=Austropuccinia psidii MF-1 TaxID=1389203 RepID=A0A9Q3F4S1_9BASI|nr:hypothetical protein [Austropuccinia psidii MF-1]
MSGKQESMGCVMLTCLNLPPTLQNKPAFSLLYSIIPGPNSPDVVTISNALKPLVDELLVLKDGFNSNTYQHPKGRTVFVQLLPICGYLVAAHKVIGFGSHSAKQFCGWCNSNLSELNLLQLGSSKPAWGILQAAQSWKEAKTTSAQELIRRETGVRWSEFN